jgi:predicted nucleotidyltransferase component of viral defense system
MNESALKERIKSIAKEKNTTFNFIWKSLALERFLARLSVSNQHDKFIFKGGLLLARYIELGRETKDIDLLMKSIKAETINVQKTFLEIIKHDLNDNFVFSWDSIENLEQAHMNYPGFRVLLNISFGKIRDKIQIDIGTGDDVDPVEQEISVFKYKEKAMFDGDVSLLVYPLEFILAEKLETIVAKGSINSRMKDFHDVFLIINQPTKINKKILTDAIDKTFTNRSTKLTSRLEFDPTEISKMQILWKNHVNGLGIFKEQLNIPSEFGKVIQKINQWLPSL